MTSRPTGATLTDPRLIIGAVIVIGAFLLGLVMFNAAGSRGGGSPAGGTVRVLAAAAELPAGHVIADGDLQAVDVAMPATAAERLVRADRRADVVGRVVKTGLVRGELLYRGALVEGVRLEEGHVALVVPAGQNVYIPPTVKAGDVVTVFASNRESGAQTAPVIEAVRVLYVRRQPQAGAEGAAAENLPITALTLAVPRQAAERLVTAVVGYAVTIGVLPEGTQPAGLPAGAGAQTPAPTPTPAPTAAPSPR